MKLLLFIVVCVVFVFLVGLFISVLKEMIHTIRNPNYHHAALQATDIILRGNRGSDVQNEVDNFNQTCIHDMLIKRTFEMSADSKGLYFSGTYYLYEGRFNKPSDGGGFACADLGGGFGF